MTVADHNIYRLANDYRIAKSRHRAAQDYLAVDETALKLREREIELQLPAEVVAEWKRLKQKLADTQAEVKAAKKVEDETKKSLVSVVFETALESGQRGREIHPAINVLSTTEVRLPHDLGQFVSWLIKQNRREDVKIDIWKLDWYRDHDHNGTLPDGVELVEVPLVRIDSDFP